MSDSLSKGFYNGKPNPFEVRTAVPYVHFPFFFFFFTVFNYFLSVCFSESSSLYLCTQLSRCHSFSSFSNCQFLLFLTSFISFHIIHTTSPTPRIPFFLLTSTHSTTSLHPYAWSRPYGNWNDHTPDLKQCQRQTLPCRVGCPRRCCCAGVGILGVVWCLQTLQKQRVLPLS